MRRKSKAILAGVISLTMLFSGMTGLVSAEGEQDLQDRLAAMEAQYIQMQSKMEQMEERLKELDPDYEPETEPETEPQTEPEPEYDIVGYVKDLTDDTFTLLTSLGNTYTFDMPGKDILGDLELDPYDGLSFHYKGNVGTGSEVLHGTISEFTMLEKAKVSAERLAEKYEKAKARIAELEAEVEMLRGMLEASGSGMETEPMTEEETEETELTAEETEPAAEETELPDLAPQKPEADAEQPEEIVTEEQTAEDEVLIIDFSDDEEETDPDEEEPEVDPDAVTYQELVDEPDDNEGAEVTFSGKVIQVITEEDSDEIQFRMAVDGNSEHVLYCGFEKDILEEKTLQNDDMITITGISVGKVSYESVTGVSVTVPAVWAETISWN